MTEKKEGKINAQTSVARRAKYLFKGDEDTKLSIQIKQKTFNLIEDYRTFHKHIAGEAVSLDTLISAIITSGMMSDKTFLGWRKEEAETKAKEEAKRKEKEADEKAAKESSEAIAKEGNSSGNSLPTVNKLFPDKEPMRAVNLQS